MEFLELDLGNPAERAQCAGLTDQVGYRGNAVLARAPLLRPRLVRLERRGEWFDGSPGERRVGALGPPGSARAALRASCARRLRMEPLRCAGRSHPAPKPGGASGADSTRGALKLDWLLCRGLRADLPRVIEAVGAGGRILSDHEAITAELRIAG